MSVIKIKILKINKKGMENDDTSLELTFLHEFDDSFVFISRSQFFDIGKYRIQNSGFGHDCSGCLRQTIISNDHQ